MTKPAHTPAPASLDSLYALIKPDLAQVDKVILGRVQQEIPLIASIAQHIVSSGGKRIRPALTLISAKACGYQGDAQLILAAAVEFIHTATLLHDDVVDESKLRRGIPTANELFGNKASVLVGDFLLSQAFQLMTASGSLKVLEILSNASAIISKGEVLQLMNEGNIDISMQDYIEVVTAKTAALFAAACELGPVVAGSTHMEQAYREFGLNLGIAFQLVDDVLDYAANQAALGKTVGDDFREGKITLPVLYALEAANAKERTFWQRTMGDHEQTHDDLTHALALIEKHNTLSRSFALVYDYCDKARQCLSGVAASPAKSAMLELVDFCANRRF